MKLEDIIAQVICDVAVREDEELRLVANEGIFHMPELAFAYECGKAIMKESSSIFNTSKVKWCREIDLGNGGPTDLVFKFSTGHKVAIEFKLRDDKFAYESDIKKLSRIDDDKCIKIFCALIDVFDSKLPDDGRQKHIETLPDQSVVLIKSINFKTQQSWYTSNVSCVVCVWSVGSVIGQKDTP